MILLVCFDLPRHTKPERKKANRFRKHLLNLGFAMKQFSIYERAVQRNETRDKIITDITRVLPQNGSVVLYEIPDYVNERQIIMIGDKVILKTSSKPMLIVL